MEGSRHIPTTCNTNAVVNAALIASCTSSDIPGLGKGTSHVCVELIRSARRQTYISLNVHPNFLSLHPPLLSLVLILALPMPKLERHKRNHQIPLGAGAKRTHEFLTPDEQYPHTPNWKSLVTLVISASILILTENR